MRRGDFADLHCVAARDGGWRSACAARTTNIEGELSEFGKKFVYATRGTGGMTHADPEDRPPEVFGGQVTLHAGGARESYLLVPFIPA